MAGLLANDLKAKQNKQANRITTDLGLDIQPGNKHEQIQGPGF